MEELKLILINNFLFLALEDVIPKNLLVSDQSIMSARVLQINASTGQVLNCEWRQRQGLEMGNPRKLTECKLLIGQRPDPDYPW